MRRMLANRITRLLLVVAVAFALVGCLATRNSLADRDLVCRETPDDICIRVADLGLTQLDLSAAEREHDSIPIIQVYPTGWPADAPEAVRSWWVEAVAESGDLLAVPVYERADGSLHLLDP